MKLYYLSLISVFFLFSSFESSGQMSVALYNKLPTSLKPKDPNNLQTAEVNSLMKHWFEHTEWKPDQYEEMYKICVTQAGRFKAIEDIEEQAEFLHNLCAYLYYSTSYAQEIDEPGVDRGDMSPSAQARLGLFYCETFVSRFKGKALRTYYFTPNIYIYKAHLLMAIEKHTDAYYALKESKNIAQKIGKPTSVSAAFASMGFLVETLGLHQLAIRHYDQAYEAIKNEPPKNKWATGQRLFIYFAKQRTYFGQYIKEDNASLADSIQKLHDDIISLERQYNGGMEAESHLAMAGVSYRQARYTQAIAHVHTARRIYPNLNLRGLENNAIAFEALSRIRLGQIKQGKAMIEHMNFAKVHNPIIERILTDLYELEIREGNHNKALEYQQILIGHLKRKAILDLRGRSLEMEQFYKVREHEIQIDNLQSLQRRNTYIGVLLVVILIIVSGIIYYRYTLGKTNGLKLINQVEKMTELHSHQIAEAKNLERKRMAQDLHDDLSASLAANMNYLRLKAAQASDETESQNSLALLDMLKESYDRVRNRSHNMYWEEQTESFIRRLEQMVDILFFGTNTKISLVSDLENFELNADAKETILLVLKESITNIIKHANASEAEVTFYLESDCLILDIVDNGKGMKKKKVSKSLGLESLERRILDLGGKLDIFGNQPSGTIVSCKFSLDLSGNFRTIFENQNIV